MQSLVINKENVKSINWEEDCFKYCEFSDISPEGGNVTADFTDCTFKDIDWYWGIFNVVNFVGCKFINCTFRGASFSDCKFVECEINGSRFTKDNLNGECSFEGSKAYNCKVINSEGFRVKNHDA